MRPGELLFSVAICFLSCRLACGEVDIRKVSGDYFAIDQMVEFHDALFFTGVPTPETPPSTDPASWVRLDKTGLVTISPVDRHISQPIEFQGSLYYEADDLLERLTDAPSSSGPPGYRTEVVNGDRLFPQLVYTPANSEPVLLSFEYEGICCVSAGGRFWSYDGVAFESFGQNVIEDTPPFRSDFVQSGDSAYSLARLRINNAPTRLATALLEYDGVNLSEIGRVDRQGDPSTPPYGFNNGVFFTEQISSGASLVRNYNGDLPLDLNVVNEDTTLYAAREYFEFNGELFFFASELPGFHRDAVDYIWKITNTGVERVVQSRPFGFDGSPGQEFYEPTEFQDAIYFSAGLDRYQPTIWRFDGESITRVTDATFGHFHGDKFQFTAIDDRLYFSGRDKNHDYAVYELTVVPEPAAGVLLFFGIIFAATLTGRRGDWASFRIESSV